MAFQLIDLENWERREFYEHFIKIDVFMEKLQRYIDRFYRKFDWFQFVQ